MFYLAEYRHIIYTISKLSVQVESLFQLELNTFNQTHSLIKLEMSYTRESGHKRLIYRILPSEVFFWMEHIELTQAGRIGKRLSPEII